MKRTGYFLLVGLEFCSTLSKDFPFGSSISVSVTSRPNVATNLRRLQQFLWGRALKMQKKTVFWPRTWEGCNSSCGALSGLEFDLALAILHTSPLLWWTLERISSKTLHLPGSSPTIFRVKSWSYALAAHNLFETLSMAERTQGIEHSDS